MTTYVGNGAYCYANSTAMLLAAAKEYTPKTFLAIEGLAAAAAAQGGVGAASAGN